MEEELSQKQKQEVAEFLMNSDQFGENIVNTIYENIVEIGSEKHPVDSQTNQEISERLITAIINELKEIREDK